MKRDFNRITALSLVLLMTTSLLASCESREESKAEFHEQKAGREPLILEDEKETHPRACLRIGIGSIFVLLFYLCRNSGRGDGGYCGNNA